MDIFKDIYNISELCVNFPLQAIFLEISNIKMYFRYIFARLKNHQIDIREKMAPITSFSAYLFDDFWTWNKVLLGLLKGMKKAVTYI